jgi:hypothetical protein
VSLSASIILYGCIQLGVIMAISSTAAIGLISLAIGSTTAASLWKERSDSEKAAGSLEQQLAMWQCSSTNTSAAGQRPSTAGTQAPGESHVTCQPNYPPNLQSASPASMFSALVR